MSAASVLSSAANSGGWPAVASTISPASWCVTPQLHRQHPSRRLQLQVWRRPRPSLRALLSRVRRGTLKLTPFQSASPAGPSHMQVVCYAPASAGLFSLRAGRVCSLEAPLPAGSNLDGALPAQSRLAGSVAVADGARHRRTRLGRPVAYHSAMSLRLRKKPPAASLAHRRGIEISRLAHNRALHYLANHPLTEDERAHLPEVVYGYTGPAMLLYKIGRAPCRETEAVSLC